MLHCFGNLLTLFSHVGHVCCGQTRQTYKLTCGSGILATERNVLVEALCTALEHRFDDTSVVKATAIAVSRYGQ